MFNLFASKKTDQQTGLMIEPLEERMMLSTVTVFAAGSTGEESFRLVAGNDTVIFENVGGNAANGNFQEFVFESTETLSASDIDIEFFNDSFDPATGRDRNLTVNRIEIDGAVFNTISNDVYSEGSFRFGNQVNGYAVGDTLYLNGKFEFGSDIEDGTLFSVFARGSTGDERYDVLVGSEVVGSASVLSDGTFGQLTIGVNREISGSDIRVRFTNDLYAPEVGIDRNLIVDRIEIGGATLQTESPEVFSTGTFRDGIGFQDGNPESETLHTNGEFTFFDAPENEIGFAGRTFQANDAVTIATMFASLQLSTTPGQGDGVIFTELEISAGESFRFLSSITRQPIAGVGLDQLGQAFIGVNYFDANGNEIGVQVFSVGTDTFISEIITAPPGTTAGGIWVVVVDAGDQTATVDLNTLVLLPL